MTLSSPGTLYFPSSSSRSSPHSCTISSGPPSFSSSRSSASLVKFDLNLSFKGVLEGFVFSWTWGSCFPSDFGGRGNVVLSELETLSGSMVYVRFQEQERRKVSKQSQGNSHLVRSQVIVPSREWPDVNDLCRSLITQVD